MEKAKIPVENDLLNTCARVAPLSQEEFAVARARLDTLTKPLGSLGRLEDIAAQWVASRQKDAGAPICKAVYVFAADHGVTVEGVSAYPSAVTHQMVLNFLGDGAAINVLARLHDARLRVVDVGVDADLEEHPLLIPRKVARGTANMACDAAMTDEQVSFALSVGLEQANKAAASGQNLVAIGEMGIGNTTAASAITSALTGNSADLVTGTGTGINDDVRMHKAAVINRALDRHFDKIPHADPIAILRNVGGLEIAAMTGMVVGLASHRIVSVCDGFISTAAAALAVALQPKVRGYLIAGHQSVEPGHRLLLDHLGLEPLLSLKMRLGEGTGAVLAMSIVESAIALYLKMATFKSAGISEVTDD